MKKTLLLLPITLMIFSCSKQDINPPRCASVTGYSYKYTLDTIPLPSETYIFYKDDNLCSLELEKVVKANQDSSHLFRVCAVDRIERRAYDIHYR